MNQKSELRRLAYFVLFIFVVNLLALKLHWYSLIWYFDMPMHFLGGAWVSLAVLWLLKAKDLSHKIIWQVFFGVLFIGVSWEIFEVVVDLGVGNHGFNVLDTMSDIFFDLSGGLTALLYYFRKRASIVII